MDKANPKTAYKIALAIAFGLMGFFTNFHPLDVVIPPNKASFVWGLVFPMLISLSWGWRYGLLSATLGLGAQTMWWLWLPNNGWAVFVAVPVYNLWIIWHGWCAEKARKGWLSNIYLADIPYRIFFAIIFATVFSWSFRFNPSPWAPHMTLTTAPPAFIKFIQFKVIFEGYMILLLADVLRNLSFIKKILLLQDTKENRSDFILSGAALFGLSFWIVSGIADHMHADDNSTLADSLILSVPQVHLMERLIVMLMCLAAGLVVAHYFYKYKESSIELQHLNADLTKYLFALESVEDEAYLIAPDGSFEYVNKAACAKLGYTKDELFALRTPDVDPLYNQDEWNAHFPELKRRGSMKFETLHKRKDGATFPVEILANHFEYEGRDYNIAFARDITERKRAENAIKMSEANLVRAQSIARLGSWEWDIAGNTLSWSAEIYRIFGLEPHAFGATYDAFLNAVHPDDRDFVSNHVSNSLESGIPYSIDHRIVHPNGTLRVVHEEGEVIRDDGGRAIAMNGTVQDITERVSAAQQIERSLREKEALLKEIHHRVKNNMAVIISLLRMQSSYVKDPGDLQMFTECQGRIMAMALVHEKLYRAESFSDINVREYLISLVESIRATNATKNGVKTEFEIDEMNMSIDILVPCGLIINELLVNSFKHAFAGSADPAIIINLKHTDKNMIRLVISDNGAGLPEGFDIASSKGLGMRLVTALCKQIDAEIGYESSAGGGTTFSLTFPDNTRFARSK